MREIKFRGCVKGIKTPKYRFVYGSHIKISDRDYILIDDGESPDDPNIAFMDMIIEVIPETNGQYTGLQDKNGKEIYEGDIVEFWQTGMPHKLRVTNEVMFVDGCFGVGDIPLKFIDKITLRVIGNIHENPELLKCTD